jgi:hypothetical protein
VNNFSEHFDLSKYIIISWIYYIIVTLSLVHTEFNNSKINRSNFDFDTSKYLEKLFRYSIICSGKLGFSFKKKKFVSLLGITKVVGTQNLKKFKIWP